MLSGFTMRTQTLIGSAFATSILFLACGGSDGAVLEPSPASPLAASADGGGQAVSPDSQDSGGGSAKLPSPGPSPVTDAGSTPVGTGDEICAASATRQKCGGCCAMSHTAGAQVAVAGATSCACKPGLCDVDCATTACAATPQKANAQCQACLDSTLGRKDADAGADAGHHDAGADGGAFGACAATQKAACDKSEDCVALDACIKTCPKQ